MTRPLLKMDTQHVGHVPRGYDLENPIYCTEYNDQRLCLRIDGLTVTWDFLPDGGCMRRISSAEDAKMPIITLEDVARYEVIRQAFVVGWHRYNDYGP